MVRNPNPEQLLAIEHEGGVLLRAGAGSGKTFVLVEHIVHLTHSWIREFKHKQAANFEEFLRQKFSQVVMMTFTKKAAGEMSIRLNDKFQELSHQISEDQPFWLVANEALPLLMVTTIDGFCRRLITAGYFPHLSTEAKIIFGPERIDQVRELVESWFVEKAETVDSSILDVIVREKEHLLSAFCNVFNDPGIRLSWKKFNIKEVTPETIGLLLKKSFELNDISSALNKIQQLDLPSTSDQSAFEKFVYGFQETGLPEVDSAEKLKLYADLFEGKRLLGESGKKKTPQHEAAKEGLVLLREWIKKWSTVVEDYNLHFDIKIRPWIETCLGLFNWIEDRLDPNLGMTFGDIEYFVSLGLENKKDRERIQNSYSYFIVDEFQDTSALQFQIIEGLISSDFKKLFCVGDAKQAIYGFRGGELSVFRDCAEHMPNVRSLANNYRSLPGIITFNNSLFATILPLGQEFSGHDPFSVNPEDQNIPQEVSFTGEQGGVEILVTSLKRDLEKDGKFSNDDINKIESEIIALSIQNERQQNPQNVCTVLYSKLRPSNSLIKSLMEKNIGFTAQFKIDLLDDPIIGIFLSLLRRQFDKNPVTRNKYPLFMLESYLKILGFEREISEQDLVNFDLGIRYWGLVQSFRKFLHSLKITNENADINLSVIETISELYHQDPESVLIQLIRGDNQRISLDLRSGKQSHMVQIMTAHASKGLEFETVYLGGIYTNGKENIEGSLFGNMPGSFKWYIDLGLRDKQKSPLYVYEDELNKYKNFSEAKRLFYVACTRAKNKLVWIDLEIPDKTFSIPKNSWIDGLRVWMNQSPLMSNKSIVTYKLVEGFDSQQLLCDQSTPQLPLYFHDSVGIFDKGKENSSLGIMAEMSVTRLNSLIDCPRKFYLENILKLEATEFLKTNNQRNHQDEDELASVISSTADRGTFIHALIAKGIEKNFIVPREVFNEKERLPVQWALDHLKQFRDQYEFEAEKPLKFKFFNFMISGIPDLILIPTGDQSTQVWDFKTGRITREKLNHYWIQLAVYAYSLFELGKVNKSNSIELVLCFVDEQKNLSLVMNWQECLNKLYPIWELQTTPWRTNPEHCSQCSYGDICPR